MKRSRPAQTPLRRQVQGACSTLLWRVGRLGVGARQGIPTLARVVGLAGIALMVHMILLLRRRRTLLRLVLVGLLQVRQRPMALTLFSQRLLPRAGVLEPGVQEHHIQRETGQTVGLAGEVRTAEQKAQVRLDKGVMGVQERSQQGHRLEAAEPLLLVPMQVQRTQMAEPVETERRLPSLGRPLLARVVVAGVDIRVGLLGLVALVVVGVVELAVVTIRALPVQQIQGAVAVGRLV